ncbi:hypothetical protein KPL47_07405 [Clostridium estertheticum]|uniref:hypothetical protein n=1 Tax=Clostridium estertheticum TaxID=238834 RepID=UPI001C0C5A07|nr:hypothetical protein [Clostridium estertheticum]MBU3176194.1 hypothetical protein [Clostridium estertheticum]
MKVKKRFSRKTLNIIDFVWVFFTIMIILIIKDIYHLNFWVYLCIAVPTLLIGQILIRKFFKVKENS